MFITRTPFRISFFGGGTDYPEWYLQHGGAVLSTAINKYCYITCRYLPPFFEHRIRAVYSQIETCQSADEITHPAIRAVIQYLEIDDGLEIHHDGDLPARSGVGSGSAFTVGLLHALSALSGMDRSKEALASESIFIEREIIGEVVGSQDQYAATFGGFNHILFDQSGAVYVDPVRVSSTRLEELNSHLMLFYTGVQRTASHFAECYIRDLDEKAYQLHRMIEMVSEGRKILEGNQSILSFGELLHEGWMLKKSLGSRISDDSIDHIYTEARRGGATGGKVVGAGGGGCLLFFVPPFAQKEVAQRLSRLLLIPFSFEPDGSQLIFARPQASHAPLLRLPLTPPERVLYDS